MEQYSNIGFPPPPVKNWEKREGILNYCQIENSPMLLLQRPFGWELTYPVAANISSFNSLVHSTCTYNYTEYVRTVYSSIALTSEWSFT